MDCCRVAERLRVLLDADGLTAFAKTSGSKGMQLYAAITTTAPTAPSAYAKRLAQQLARETPDVSAAVGHPRRFRRPMARRRTTRT